MKCSRISLKAWSVRILSACLILISLWPWPSSGQDFKKWEAKTKEYKQWLDLHGSEGSRLWLRIDSSRRPHRLYVGEAFHKANHKEKEQFVEIFSHYLAGHPEKFTLIDIFDSVTGKPVGEFGWGGFKLY
ncbi:MAG: hypothetical protein ACREQA_21015 [Candidatus Binatia bacterium]